MGVIKEYVQAREMMEILGVTRQQVYRLIAKDPQFPEAHYLPKSPTRLWVRDDVEDYASQRNRKRGPRR